MKRSVKIKWGKMKIGIIVALAIVALLYSSFRGGGTSIFEGKDQVVVYFDNVNGLVKGAPVWLGGVEVGNVKSLKFVNIDKNRRIKAIITIKKSVWEFMTMDTKAQLGTIGLLGDKYVEIIPGSKDLPLVEPGAEIDVIKQSGLAGITQKAPSMIGSMDSLLVCLKGISTKINSGEGTAGKLITDSMLYHKLVYAIDEAVTIMAGIQKKQSKILEGLSVSFDNAGKISEKLNSGTGTAGKLIQDEELYDNLSRSSGSLDSILAKIDRGQGSAGALVNDAELYEEMRNLIVRINNLVADIEENPRKYFKFSVF